MPGIDSASNHSALVALPVAVLDLETTGLDVRRDRIVQIGVVRMRGAETLDSPRIDQLIDPEMPIPALASGIHGITDADVAGAPRFADYAQTLSEILAGCVVVGHHAAFDLAVLRHEAARAGVAWREPLALDLALLAGALQPTLADVGLETVADLFGVEIEERHTALGDCITSARVFARLLPRLREAGVRTLAEAVAFGARRADLVQREIQSGWHAVPGEGAPAPEEPPPLRIDSFVFGRHVRDLMHSPPVTVDADASLLEAARLMLDRGVGSLLVGEPGGVPEGILTERDLLRATADRTRDLEQTVVRNAMSTPVACIAVSELVYRALGRMDRLGIRHLCVTDEHGAALGMVSQRDLLHHRARASVVLGDALHEADDLSSLASAFSRVPAVAGQLVADGLSGREVARVVSTEICALTARAAELTRARLAEDGKMPPASPWCVLVLGSGGRGESLLSADQDNALIVGGAEYDDAWFDAFGRGVADLLDAAGLRRCDGGVMVSNRGWRGSEPDWRARIEGWLSRARPEDLLNVDIFFDMTPVAGDRRLAFELHLQAVEAASRSPAFLALLAQSVGSLTPRFGLFGKLRAEEGRIDLKRDGLLPLVSLARVVALRTGSTARATADRLRDAAAQGRMSERDVEVLIELHGQLLDLVLKQQLIDIDRGVPPSSRVEVRALSKRERTSLKHGLHRLDHILPIVHSIAAR